MVIFPLFSGGAHPKRAVGQTQSVDIMIFYGKRYPQPEKEIFNCFYTNSTRPFPPPPPSAPGRPHEKMWGRPGSKNPANGFHSAPNSEKRVSRKCFAGFSRLQREVFQRIRNPRMKTEDENGGPLRERRSSVRRCPRPCAIPDFSPGSSVYRTDTFSFCLLSKVAPLQPDE